MNSIDNVHYNDTNKQLVHTNVKQKYGINYTLQRNTLEV